MKKIKANFVWHQTTGEKLRKGTAEADEALESGAEEGDDKAVFIVGDDHSLLDGESLYLVKDASSTVTIKTFLDLLGFDTLVEISSLKKQSDEFAANFEAAEVMMSSRENVTLDSLSLQKYFAMLKAAGILDDDEISRIKRNELPNS